MAEINIETPIMSIQQVHNFGLALHPILPILATGSTWRRADNNAYLFSFNSNLRSSTCVATLQGHSQSVSCVAFHRTFPILATGSNDYTAKLWQFNPDGSAASCIATLQGHRNSVRSVAFHAIFPILVTGSADKTAKFWRLNSDNSAPSCVATLRGHYNWVYCVKFHASLPILSSIDFDNGIKLWLLNTEGIVVDSTDENIEEFLQQYKHPAIGGSLQNESRFFKLVSVNGKEVDGGRYELPSKTKSGKAQTRGPKDKASFAFSEICKKNNKKGECSYKFAIQETTRGSNKKVYHYEGKRVKLTKPIILELKDKKTGKVKKVVKKYKNIIVATH